MTLLTDIFSVAVITIGFLISYLNFRFWRRSNDGWRWIKLAYGLIGLGWAILYIFVLEQSMENLGQLGPLFFRPFLLVTLATIGAGGLIRNKTL